MSRNNCDLSDKTLLMSWFGTKAEQGVVYTSPRNSLDKPQKRLPYSTPHDAILEGLHSSPDRVASPEPIDINIVITPTPSLYQPSRLSSPPPDLLFDPFNGTSLGTLLPHSQDSEVQPDHHSMPSQINLSSPEVGPSQNANAAIPSELVWSHLSNIMDLQSQISKKHLEMENFGHIDVKSKKHTFSHKPTPSNVSTTGIIGSGAKRSAPEPPGSSTRERALSTASTISSSGCDPEGDDENVDVPNEEAEKNRAREEEFASLAQQFEGKKEAINDIMGKVCKLSFSDPCLIQRFNSQLDDLFNVLSEFHSLQAPSLDFPSSRQQSRTDSGTSAKGPQTESRV